LVKGLFDIFLHRVNAILEVLEHGDDGLFVISPCRRLCGNSLRTTFPAGVAILLRLVAPLIPGFITITLVIIAIPAAWR
jgi:hypothetical protein